MRQYDDLNIELNDKFNPKKRDSRKLAQCYKRLGLQKKYSTVNKCAETIVYDVYEDGTTRLKRCLFCKDSLCPLCAWRKELKMFHDVSRIVDVLQAQNYNFVLVTLSIRNIENDGEKLKETIDLYNRAYANMIRNKRLKGVIKGAFRAIEVTYDGNKTITPKMYRRKRRYYKRLGLKVGCPNPNFDKLHPHIHIIWVLDPDYYINGDYVSERELCDLWKQALGVDYTPVCDIRKIAPKKVYDNGRLVATDLKGAVAEVCKYTVKSTDYLSYDNEINDKVIKSLVTGLSNRRMVSYYGVFAEVRQSLKLEDNEEDLVHVDNVKVDGDVKVVFTMYFGWSTKTNSYINYSVVVKSIDIQCDDDDLKTG